MAECRDCGKGKLVWGRTAKGKAILMELVPHFIRCPKRQKRNGRPQVRIGKRDLFQGMAPEEADRLMEWIAEAEKGGSGE